MMNVVNFIRKIKSDVKTADDIDIYAMIMMRFKDAQLCSDMDDGFVVCVGGVYYDINGMYCGKAKPVKFSDEDIIEMFNDR